MTEQLTRSGVEQQTLPDLPVGGGVRAHAALLAAREHLLSLQDDAGWWKGELQTNVTMDVEDLLMRQFLGIRTPGETERAARWIRSQQREDGTWANFHGGPGELSTTVEAYTALKLAGDASDAEHMITARSWILAHGGIEGTRVFTRIWLALFGEWSWDDLPAMPPEVVLLGKSVPLNLADWACWARQTVVPLTVVCTLRPSRELGVSVSELRTGRSAPRPAGAWDRAFHALDAVLHRYQRRPVKALRELSMRRAAEWIVARQEADGSWGGIQPPWVYSLLALHLLGYPLEHPVLREGLAGLDGFLIHELTPDGPVRRMEACQSPVWDTVLSVQALRDAGLAADHPALRCAADYLLAEEVRVTGDWAVRRPNLAPGGWAFEFENDGYPDTDDTAVALLALNRVEHTKPVAVRRALDRGVHWLRGMQSRDGGWGAFDADNTGTLVTRLPFCDFGEVIDPPSADVTAHVVEALAALGHRDDPVVRAGVRWLLENQEADGSWFGRWGANHLYGTGAAVPALVEAGLPASHPALRRAARWLEQHQNSDGGWGEDMRSYTDARWIGVGTSTASQTGWALMALLAVGAHTGEAVRNGVEFLATTQRPDGTWDEPHYTGTGFPGDFLINYHLYRLIFPLTALGRYERAVAR
ncbi:squalene--hopene cyclase [Saccharopolyspora gloriosae]|uniref:Squalene-hopene/tetraprenyl-beta-curcumene cyclase n=1 Tax=Saccharopolyspora gloriosae TaxID=455344 RepID=A0A840NJ09_9PSEU|nr:squalene-hopene/tetraprenyl-beta-curcumene cyclase [Saccharopolyspora gloriosae]